MSQPTKLAWGLWPCLAVAIGLWWLDNAWAAIFLNHAAILTGILRQRQVVREISRGFRWLPALGGLAIGVATLPAVILLLPPLVGLNFAATGEVLRQKLNATGLAWPWFAVFFALFVTLHPILEELGWRAILGTKSRFLRLVDIEFAAYHLLVLGYFFPNAWPLLVVTFLVLSGAAWLWRQMRASLGGLASVILFHAAADAGILAAVWRMT